ncbi:MAG: stage II sporulation protein R [Clostridia bacterium]
MRKNTLFIIFAFILLSFSVVLLSACNSFSQQQLSAECVRIHIRANSNDDCDQNVKLKVRDEITKYLTVQLEGCLDKNDAIATLSSEIPQLTAIADNTLQKHGYQYKSQVRLSNEYFPERKYDGYDFPKGNYDALIVELGSGVGDNWWCVAFPPLCFIPDSGNGEKIVYKSWIKEKLDKMF